MSRFFPNYKENKITSPYGMRTINGVKSMHYGIDLVAKATDGTSRVDYITAHTAGVVSRVGYEPNGAGNYVYINVESGVEMAYFHFAKVNVKKGQRVKAGEVIGYMGSTGRSTGAHLHWGIKVNNNWIDPTDYLDKEWASVKPSPKGEVKVTITLNMLQKGSKGEQVKTLQRLLIMLGYSCGSAGVDGDFGNGTLNAVIAYQKANKLSADGIVGKDTWTALLT